MGWKGGFIRCQLDVEFHGASKFDKPFFFIFSGWKVMATKIWGIFCFLQRGGVPNLAPYQKRASGWNWNPSEESIWCRISWGFYIFLVSKAHSPSFKSYGHPTFGCQKAMQATSQQSWVCLSQLKCPHKQAEGLIDLELGEKCGCNTRIQRG